MTQGAISRGVSLYSFQNEYFLRKWTLEECIAKSASLGALGIEIIGEQMFPGFPTLTDDFVRQWLSWMDKYGSTPTCHDMFLDTKRYKHRRLTQKEEVESVERDLRFANRLGCKVMRVIVSASPETMERCLPLAEKYRIKMAIEVHSPFHLDHAWIMRHIELMERTGTECYGLLPDMGIFTSRYPRVQRDRFVRNGVRPQFADYIASAYEQRMLPDYIIGNVREMNPTPIELAMAESTRHIVWTNPERLREHAKRIFHIHGKFLEMIDDRNEFSIPYDKVVAVLRDSGYRGYISSEYEGNRHIEDVQPVDSFEQVRRHQSMLKHLLGEN
jgi:sugar phosphate isomerase/epimerase